MSNPTRDRPRLICKSRSSPTWICLSTRPKNPAASARQAPRIPGNPPKNQAVRLFKPGAKAGQKPGNKPAAASSSRSPDGQPRKPDMDEMRSLINNLWGELPPHVRDQMLQTPVEEFIPKYQDLIEDYFRDLSNEKKPGE